MDQRLITTVTTGASDTNLVDLASVKASLGLTGTSADAQLAVLISAASAFAARYCGRAFVVESLKDEFLTGRVRQALSLSRWPIMAVASVTENSVALVADTDFRVDATNGRLLRLDGCGYLSDWYWWPIVVEYSAGYQTIPGDLADGVTRMVKARWFARDRDPQLRAESAVGIYEAQYWFGSGPDAVGGLPPDIAAIFDLYRVPMIG